NPAARLTKTPYHWYLAFEMKRLSLLLGVRILQSRKNYQVTKRYLLSLEWLLHILGERKRATLDFDAPDERSSQQLQVVGLQKIFNNFSCSRHIAVRDENFYGAEAARRRGIRRDHTGEFIPENRVDIFSFEHAFQKVCLNDVARVDYGEILMKHMHPLI